MYIDSYAKVKTILKEYDKFKVEIAKDILKELKSDCKTYGDLETVLNQFERDYRYEKIGDLPEDILSTVRGMLCEEKSSLLITGCL